MSELCFLTSQGPENSIKTRKLETLVKCKCIVFKSDMLFVLDPVELSANHRMCCVLRGGLAHLELLEL